MDWNSNRQVAAFSAAGMAAVVLSSVATNLLLPEEGLWTVLRGVVPAGLGGALGVFMMQQLGESRLGDMKE